MRSMPRKYRNFYKARAPKDLKRKDYSYFSASSWKEGNDENPFYSDVNRRHNASGTFAHFFRAIAQYGEYA